MPRPSGQIYRFVQGSQAPAAVRYRRKLDPAEVEGYEVYLDPSRAVVYLLVKKNS
jgi:hypothetical protein